MDAVWEVQPHVLLHEWKECNPGDMCLSGPGKGHAGVPFHCVMPEQNCNAMHIPCVSLSFQGMPHCHQLKLIWACVFKFLSRASDLRGHQVYNLQHNPKLMMWLIVAVQQMYVRIELGNKGSMKLEWLCMRTNQGHMRHKYIPIDDWPIIPAVEFQS